MKSQVPFGMVVSTMYGPVIVDRYDTNQTNALIKTGRAIDHRDIVALCGFLQLAPDKAVCLDVGACYGLYGLAFARTLVSQNGQVHAFEAQRILSQMVAGTASLNGIENLFIHHQAVGAQPGRIPIPQFNYNKMSSFGSVEFGDTQKEFIGQPRLCRPEKQEYVDVVSLDSLELDNVYLIKMDIEGMEEAGLIGARKLIERNTPLLWIEWIKSNKQNLIHFCKGIGYRVFEWGMNLMCVHRSKQHIYSINFKLKEL